MAPKKRSSAKDDDFVLTLSDDELDRFDNVDGDSDDGAELSSKKKSESATKKRKRDGV
ncbi:hypothetical protein BDW59DRAFT_147889, partial [Aspergillus cavernicola]